LPDESRKSVARTSVRPILITISLDAPRGTWVL
jgi:hypothetical protein